MSFHLSFHFLPSFISRTLGGYVSLETVHLVVGGRARIAGGREVNPTRQGLPRANDLTLAKKLLVKDKPHLHELKCLTSFISKSSRFKRSFWR